MKKIIIIGGGIAGLAAATRIQQEISAGTQLECALFEGSERFGGKISTEKMDGFVIERGPDSFISQKPAAIQFCKQLGIEDHLVGTNPETPNTYVYTGGKLVTMPDGLSLMIPTKFLPFAFTPLFSLMGKIRMAFDLLIPKKADDSDESLASFVRRRMGEEALRKMAEPMLAGIYASDPETMSIGSTFPMFVETERKYRSLILGMLARKKAMLLNANKRPASKFSLFMTLKDGLGEMVDTAIKKSPDVQFQSGARVESISGKEGDWSVYLEGGGEYKAQAVILATPGHITARLLQPVAPAAAEVLKQVKYVSTATVTLGYKKEGFSHALDGFGFVVPKCENRSILACTWTSSKFPHRAPEGYVMLRCYLGGALREDIAEKDEHTMTRLVRQDLKEIMGIEEKPVFCKVFHNRKSNVQYQVNHSVRIDTLMKELDAFPGLFLAGSAYRGIGIPDCIQSGNESAESVIQFLADKSKAEI
ncbi:MAG: protoporphyrinogen oxidase [Nitrospina sp.]|jgi:protoporphyrinogen/coproporphyrinogen III oxidase|nr:protoporphyrinogen oxidase [Nitrospina sp.]MBT5028697.1 protoporphyrinogen oxidase [Nitrospina sp.]MBT6345174.1 protoporphyrinogen oxidase [Nitrospina sp.]